MGEVNKYQLSIRKVKKGDKNSAATKAVLDCNHLFSQRGYIDYSYTFEEGELLFKYYFNVLRSFIKFYFAIPKHSIVAVQYPMLNKTFKHLIKASAYKKVKFFCIIHDIESLRQGGTDKEAVKREVADLNCYDCIIVHNSKMKKWLTQKGITKEMITLELFDYITTLQPRVTLNFDKQVVYAGNLSKSSFIYQLYKVEGWNFNVYGPFFEEQKLTGNNMRWRGEYTSEELLENLVGSFGLIWDGSNITECDKILGNYLRYNNPHKLSLYLAAGLPVIAPAESAIAELIRRNKIGILVNNLEELSEVQLAEEDYHTMRNGCIEMSRKVSSGYFFLNALEQTEQYLFVQN